MPRIGISLGIGRQRFAGGFADSYSARVLADGGTVESLTCVANASALLQQASLLFIPSGYKAGVAYSALPNNGNGDLTWTRNSTANRTNSSGLIESVGANVPRLSYMYGSCPSALLEPQRTNLVVRSEEFDNASWSKQDVTVTANSITSPDGSANADTIVANSTTTNHDVNQLLSITSGVNYTISAYFKKGTTRYVYIQSQTTGASGLVVFDLDTATFTQQTTYVGSFSSVGSGWYRVVATFTATATTSVRMRFGLTSSSTNPTSALTTSDNVYIWGSQLEAGAYATTYIPTTTATATRLTDTFTRNNIYTNGLIGASGGTWYVELKNNVAYTRDAGVFGLFLANDINSNTGFRIKTTSGTLRRLNIFVVINGSEGETYLTTTDNVKIAIKWNGTTADVFVNGVKVISATAFTATQLESLNHSTNGDVPKFIQAMALFNTPLSDSDCITLTT